MAGMDRYTGKWLAGWAHVVQSLGDLFTTGLGTRVMAREYGSILPRLLGENIVPSALIRLVTAIIVAVELWEPRFRLIRVVVGTSGDEARSGELRLALVGRYRPRGHLGDPTEEHRDREVYMDRSGIVLPVP